MTCSQTLARQTVHHPPRKPSVAHHLTYTACWLRAHCPQYYFTTAPLCASPALFPRGGPVRTRRLPPVPLLLTNMARIS
jgi:hypothetical protein